MNLSIILPTYNERENIILLLESIENVLQTSDLADYEILVMDDNSPDGTADAVRSAFSSKGNKIRAVVRTENRGLAPSILDGLKTASGEFVLVMDSDFNHSPEDIPALLSARNHFDIIIGSRYVTGGGMLTSQFRYWGSYVFNHFLKALLLLPTNDNLSGFFLFRRQVLESMPMDDLIQGYGDYAIRVLYWAKLQKLRILEIPVVYRFRKGGSSKTNFSVYTWLYIRTAFALRWKSLMLPRKKRTEVE